MGSWTSEGKFVSAIVDASATKTDMVSIKFADQYNQQIELFYPLDYKSSPSNSIFVSQRGEKRARVRVYSDNTTDAPAQDE